MRTLLTLPDMKVYQRNLLWWNSSTLKPEFLPCVLLDQLALPFTRRPLSLVKPLTPNSFGFFSSTLLTRTAGGEEPVAIAGNLLCGERYDTNNRLVCQTLMNRGEEKRLFFCFAV